MIDRSSAAEDHDVDTSCTTPTILPLVRNLTTNQRMVYETLLNLGRSAGAYELLGILKKKGVNAAATVYRALNDLTRKGLVQRIVSTRTFIAHQQPKHKDDESILLICDHCGEVSSIIDNQIIKVFNKNIKQNGYHVSTYHLELMVCCDACARKGN